MSTALTSRSLKLCERIQDSKLLIETRQPGEGLPCLEGLLGAITDNTDDKVFDLSGNVSCYGLWRVLSRVSRPYRDWDYIISHFTWSAVSIDHCYRLSVGESSDLVRQAVQLKHICHMANVPRNRNVATATTTTTTPSDNA